MEPIFDETVLLPHNEKIIITALAHKPFMMF